mmetsp:Transcript_30955/g.106454  ORF Transcript_30955/g.106454 Transcript_30955/m.106454 type:complete len:105 (-) Transcript_30955:32-346(-)
MGRVRTDSRGDPFPRKPVSKERCRFGQEAFSDKGPGYKVDPACVGALYRDMIIPLTKQVQVRYILHKLGHADKIPAEKSAWPAHLRAFQTDRRPAKAATADADY